MADLAALTKAIEDGDRTNAILHTKQAIEAGVDPQAILDAMTAAMDVIGGRFQRGEIYVPEMLISARAMKEAMAVLEPVLAERGDPAGGDAPSSGPSRATSTTSARTSSR